MINFTVIFLCILAGLVARKVKKFPANTAVAINQIIIHLSFPALVLYQFPRLLLSLDLSGFWYAPVTMAWIAFVFSWIVISALGKHMQWTKAKTGALILTAGLGNTSFVGFPLIEAIVGEQGIPTAVLVDQPGTFLVLSTLGILVASSYSGTQKVTARAIARRVFTFPPLIAMVLSILWFIVFGKRTDINWTYLFMPLEKIGSTLIPLALFSVGFQLDFNPSVLKRRWLALAIGLNFKLLLIPAFFSFFYLLLLGNTLTSQVIILESAMATMITSAVVAQEFNLDTELANLMVGISIPVSLITVPLWNWILF